MKMKMMMMMMMMGMVGKMSLWLLLLSLAVTHTTTAAAAGGRGSCASRCGEAFTRGLHCTCDFACQQHNECCPDFQTLCIKAQSCQGRCGEAFRRGRACDCDPQCVQYNTCCHDYQLTCDTRSLQPLWTAASGKRRSDRKRKGSNSESEEWYTVARGRGASGRLHPLTAISSGSAPPVGPANHGVGNLPVRPLPVFVPSSHSSTPDSPAPGSALHSYSGPSLGGLAPVGPSGPAVNVHLLLTPGGEAPSVPSQVLSNSAGSKPRPSTLQDVAQALGLSLVEGGTEATGTGLLADVNLCSDSPINGLTALSNGTILIFKGDQFWTLDPVSRAVGRPQSISETLGVPSPIDTVFTRCNCLGHTYIIKGDQVWRLDGNMVVEPGYPKPLTSEFPGLTGTINAALAVPATRSTPEIVFFFKNGDNMHRFFFPAGSALPCSNKPSRVARQAEVLLSGEINIKVSLQGFPSPVTSALSLPSPQRSNLYEHYVFSGPLFFSVQISSNLPELVKPDPSAIFAPLPILSPTLAAGTTNSARVAAHNALLSPPQPANSIRVWLRCP